MPEAEIPAAGRPARYDRKILIVNMTLDVVSGGGSVARAVQSRAAIEGLTGECRIVTTWRRTDRLPAGVDPSSILRLPAVGGRFHIPWAGFSQLRAAIRSADLLVLMNHWTVINVVAYLIARRTRTPYLVSPAGALPLEGRSRSLKRWYNRLFGRRIVREAAGHVAVTDDERQHFAPYGVNPSSVTVIPNGMSPVPNGDARRFRLRLGLGEAPFVLFLGRLAPIKGPDLLLEAFSAVASDRPGWHLVLAGSDDGLRDALRARASHLGLQNRVHFPGFLDESAKSDALASADLLAVPSRREAMSVVVLEAASAGRPILVTDQCGIPGVEETGAGWSAPATASGIAAALADATKDRTELRRRGRTWCDVARTRYSWAAVSEKYVEEFESALARRSG